MSYRALLAASLALGPVLALAATGREPPPVPPPPVPQVPPTPWLRSISVTGEGRAMARPDVAFVRIGIESIAKQLAVANKQANDTMQQVMKVIESSGISSKDVQTTSYNVSIERRFDPQTQQPIFEGFRVINQVQVKIRDLSKVGPIIDRAIAAGANNIDSVTFTVEDPTPVKARARAQAIERAREQATQIARLTNVQLGPVVQAIDEPTYRFPPGPVPFARMDEAAVAASTPIAPGELEFTVRVQVVYEIR